MHALSCHRHEYLDSRAMSLGAMQSLHQQTAVHCCVLKYCTTLCQITAVGSSTWGLLHEQLLTFALRCANQPKICQSMARLLCAACVLAVDNIDHSVCQTGQVSVDQL